MKQIVIASGKGGTGKTSITAALCGMGGAKVIADCDVDAPDMHLILSPDVLETKDFISGETFAIDEDKCLKCGLCREHCRFDAISEDLRIVEEQCEGCGVCKLVCPEEAVVESPRKCGVTHRSDTRFGPMLHAELFPGEENSGRLVTTVRNSAAQLAEETGAGFVLVDGSPGIGCPVIASLTGTDLALLVAEPTATARHDLERVHELTKHFKIPTALVLNKTGINPEQEDDIRTFCRERNIPLLGDLPYDQVFFAAQSRGKTIAEHDPEGLGRKVSEIWQNLENLLNQ